MKDQTIVTEVLSSLTQYRQMRHVFRVMLDYGIEDVLLERDIAVPVTRAYREDVGDFAYNLLRISETETRAEVVIVAYGFWHLVELLPVMQHEELVALNELLSPLSSRLLDSRVHPRNVFSRVSEFYAAL